MPRTFVARLGDREVAVEISETGSGQYRIVIDGEERTVDARRVGTHQLNLSFDGRIHEASVVRSGDDYDVLIANHRTLFDLVAEDKARRDRARAGEASRGRREIKASMPGKVVDVLVKVGDAVEAQQGLLIVEAMKMENEIRSPGAGEVKEIHAAAGEAVESGEVLLVIE